MAKILLTGSHGYLGRHLFQALSSRGHHLTRLVHKPEMRNPQDISHSDLTRIPNDFGVILHTATCYRQSGETDSEVREANVTKALLLLDFANRNPHSVFFNIDTALRPDINIYAATKREFRNHLKEKSNVFVNLILDHFYGENDSEKKFPTWLSRQLLFSSQPIPLTLGTQIRNFIHIDDLVTTLVAMVERKIATTEMMALQGPDSIAIRDLAKLLCELSEQPVSRLEFGKIPPRTIDGQEIAPLENSAIVSPIGQLMPLRLGLQRLIEAEKQRR